MTCTYGVKIQFPHYRSNAHLTLMSHLVWGGMWPNGSVPPAAAAHISPRAMRRNTCPARATFSMVLRSLVYLTATLTTARESLLCEDHTGTPTPNEPQVRLVPQLSSPLAARLLLWSPPLPVIKGTVSNYITAFFHSYQTLISGKL